MPRKKITDDTTETAGRLPKVTSVVKRSDIITRRLANPFGQGSISLPCKLKDRQNQPLYLFRERNGDIGDAHVHRAILAGWDFATPEDIDGNIEDYGWEWRNNRLVKGERGKILLLKILASDFALIQQAKSAKNAASVRGVKGIVEQASAELGDQGASFLHQNLSNLDVKDSMERIPTDEL